MEGYVKVEPKELMENAFRLIGVDWMLITAGNPGSFNTMTASWGGLGVLWNKNVCFIFIRPQRFTYEFMERSEFFTLSFFEEKYRKALQFCGAHSGRDTDKVAKTGITPRSGEHGSVFFDEARVVMECRKIYFQDIQPENFLSPEIAPNYQSGDYHRMYIGEMLGCWEK